MLVYVKARLDDFKITTEVEVGRKVEHNFPVRLPRDVTLSSERKRTRTRTPGGFSAADGWAFMVAIALRLNNVL